MIQQTFNAATAEKCGLAGIGVRANLEAADLSGMPASVKAEGSTKDHFAGKRNTYGRQLAMGSDSKDPGDCDRIASS